MDADGSQTCDDSIPLLFSDTRFVKDKIRRIQGCGHILNLPLFN
jgi:hypothetical protein